MHAALPVSLGIVVAETIISFDAVTVACCLVACDEDDGGIGGGATDCFLGAIFGGRSMAIEDSLRHFIRFMGDASASH